MSNQKHYFCTTAKLTFWLFENPSIYTLSVYWLHRTTA
jgi:hypothetical protein